MSMQQLLDQRWVMVEVVAWQNVIVGVLTLVQHQLVQHLIKFVSTVEVLLFAQPYVDTQD